MGSLLALFGIVGVIILIAILIIPYIFYCIELQNTLKEIKPENRKMNPGQVWLLYVPFFRWYWSFAVVNNIADSLKLEFEQRGIKADVERPGFAFGLVYAILSVVSDFVLVLSPVSLGFFIVYWVKIRGYRKLLVESKNAA
jgi:hypothetical protein